MNLYTTQLSDENLLLALEAEGVRILEQARCDRSGRAGKLLASRNGTAVVIIGLVPGATIERRRTVGPVCIEVLRGRIQVAETSPLCIGPKQALMLPTHGSYALRANTETVLLLSTEVQPPSI